MSLIENYKEKVSIFDGNVIIKTTKWNNYLCFVSKYPEMLYAIRDSLVESIDYFDMQVSNCLLGSMLVINNKNIPPNPQFNNLIANFKRQYFWRLNQIENDFSDIELSFLLDQKNKLLNSVTIVFDNDSDDLDEVNGNVKFNLKPYLDLRQKYVTLEYLD